MDFGKDQNRIIPTFVPGNPGALLLPPHLPYKEKNLKWLQDDTSNLSAWPRKKIDDYGEGVVGYITNNAYLDNPTSGE